MQALLVEDDYVSSAALFTARKYALVGHMRRLTGESSIYHPRELAAQLSLIPHNREMVAAAWLTRLLQDEYTDSDEIETCFGQKTAALVTAMVSFNLPDCAALHALAKVNFNAIRCADAILQTMALADLLVLAQGLPATERDKTPTLTDWLSRHLSAFPAANAWLVEKVRGWLSGERLESACSEQVG